MTRKRPTTSKVRVTPSTGNVFRDLEFRARESAHLLVRADLLIKVQERIEEQHLTQVQAARILRVSQPRVSDLLRGRIDLFSTDTLLDMLACLGLLVQVSFKLKGQGQGRGRSRRVA